MGESSGGYGGMGGVLHPPQTLKKQILSGKFMAANISVRQIWKFCLGRTFIAAFCSSLVFEFMNFFLRLFFNLCLVGKTETRQAQQRNYIVKFQVKCQLHFCLSSRARRAHLRFEMRKSSLKY